MTATVDLVVFRATLGVSEVYEPWWLLAHYTDTSGLWEGRDKMTEHFEVKGKGVIIDALFGDGPERYGFTTNRPVILADYSSFRGRCATNFSESHHPGKQHVILRSKLSTCLLREYTGVQALSLVEYVAFLTKIPAEDMQKGFGSLVPMNAFLSALEPKDESIILPVIGAGLAYEIESVRKACGHRGGIIPADYIE